MCTLLTLPNETLLQIIAETCPDGIEELDLCCKSLHKLARGSMTQHKADRKDYWGRFLARPRQQQLPLGIEPVKPICLSEIMFRPRLASYVQHLCVSYEQLSEPPGALQPFPSLAMTTRDGAWQDFLAISKCPYISKEDAAHWQEMLDCADIQTVTSLLLTLLPNLRTFYLCIFEDTSKIIHIVNGIASASQSSKRANGQPSALSKLCFFRISHGSRRNTAGLWESFAMLPSMRCMRHGGFIREDLERWYSHESRSSEVTELQSESGDLSMETLTRLCSLITSLERFEYNENHGGFSKYVFILSDIASLVQIHAGHSLKELCLSTYENWRPTGPFVQNFVGSLQGFDRLEKIEITFNSLVREMAGTLAVSKLMDIMPASLRELHVWLPNVRSVVDLMGGMFAGIEEWKKARLPNLELVVFRRHRYTGDEVTELPLDNDTKLRCEICGVSFEVRAWAAWRKQYY